MRAKPAFLHIGFLTALLAAVLQFALFTTSLPNEGSPGALSSFRAAICMPHEAAPDRHLPASLSPVCPICLATAVPPGLVPVVGQAPLPRPAGFAPYLLLLRPLQHAGAVLAASYPRGPPLG